MRALALVTLVRARGAFGKLSPDGVLLVFYVYSGCVRPVGLSSVDRRGGSFDRLRTNGNGNGARERGTRNGERLRGTAAGSAVWRTGHSIKQSAASRRQSFNFTFVAINTPPTNAPSACTFLPLKVAAVRPPK
jgi:hypothetical protein